MKNELNSKQVKDLLKRVFDPELMVNIIDLGLVNDVQIDKENKTIEVSMTLTSPGCPLGDVIIEDVRQVVKNEMDQFDVSVEFVWEPPWTLDRLTKEGKEALGRMN